MGVCKWKPKCFVWRKTSPISSADLVAVHNFEVDFGCKTVGSKCNVNITPKGFDDFNDHPGVTSPPYPNNAVGRGDVDVSWPIECEGGGLGYKIKLLAIGLYNIFDKDGKVTRTLEWNADGEWMLCCCCGDESDPLDYTIKNIDKPAGSVSRSISLRFSAPERSRCDDSFSTNTYHVKFFPFAWPWW